MSSLTTRKQSIDERQKHIEDIYTKWNKHTLASHFQVQSERHTNKPCLIMPQKVYTYKDIYKEAEDYARALVHLGVEEDDHIIIIMENSFEFLALVIAVSMVGGVSVLINTKLPYEDIKSLIYKSHAKWLFLHQKIGEQNHADHLSLLVENLKFQPNPFFQEAICIPNTADRIPKFYMNWAQFLYNAEKIEESDFEKRKNNIRDADKLAIITYTSGSMGMPKGAMLTSDMLLRSAYATCLTRGYEEGRRIYAPLPMYHVYFLQEAFLAGSFMGASIIHSAKFEPVLALEYLEKFKVNDFITLPTMVISILKNMNHTFYNLDSLYAMLSCATPSPAPLWKNIVERFGVTELMIGYGLTETSSTVVLTNAVDPLERVETYVGRPKKAGMASGNIDFQIVDMETKEFLPPGNSGELVVKGEVVTKEFYNIDEDLKNPFLENGYLPTGDICRINEYGYIEWLGRINDIFEHEGITIFPKEIEDIITQHKDIAQAKVIGTVNGDICMFVELKNKKTANKSDLQSWCETHLEKRKIPQFIWFMKNEDWPLTGTGKIKMDVLREMANKDVN